MAERADIAIIGAGAAGLMATIWAGRSLAPGASRRIVALDGARTLGAKILVAGGGRCNVTHDVVDASAYASSHRAAPTIIRRVLSRLDVPATVAFFRELGVELKREETGKLFPVTDSARTVLAALLDAAHSAGAQIHHPWRVERLERDAETGEFAIHRDDGASLRARRVILATGGMALPKSGSDGLGYALARAMGHTTTQRIFPALVPIVLEATCFVRGLSGLAVPSTLEVRSGTGKKLAAFTGSTLCTHFGLSGPAPLDISRFYLDARASDLGARLLINWLPAVSLEAFDQLLVSRRSVSPLRLLTSEPARLPERLARALCAEAGVEASATTEHLTRDRRRALATALTEMPLPVTGDRGFTYAEVTAGGVALDEVNPATMESRRCPGLHLCGEILDVDGRIGGYNFQWAWASGYIAGTAAGTHIPEVE